MTLVSVIIAAYNAEKYIVEAIDSVLGQTWPNVECLVIDDGSTDRTADIVKSYGSRLRYIYQKNAERSAARNCGLAEASGDYVSFLDADDKIAPEKIAEQVAFLDAHQEYGLVYSRVLYFRGETRRDHFSIWRPAPSGSVIPELVFRNFINLSSPLIRKTDALAVGGFDTAYSLNEDWDFWLRLAVRGVQFGYLDKIHTYYRVHEGSSSSNRLAMYESKFHVAQKCISRFRDHLQGMGIDCSAVLAFHQADYGRGLILHGQVKQGKSEIAAACRTRFRWRWLFHLFSLSAGLFGYRHLAVLQRLWRGEL